MAHNSATYKLHLHEEERIVLDRALEHIMQGGGVVVVRPTSPRGYALKLSRFVSAYETQMGDNDRYKYSLLVFKPADDYLEIREASQVSLPKMFAEDGSEIGDD
jgi:hypothetical protein